MGKKATVGIVAAAVLVVAVVGVFMGIAAAIAVRHVTRVETLVWDLRKGYTPAAVGWPAGAGDEYERHGAFELTIIDERGETVFRQPTQHFYCGRDGGKLKYVYVHFAQGSSGEEAYSTMRKILTDWNSPPSAFVTLEKWHGGISTRMDYGSFVRLYDSDRTFQPGLYPNFEGGEGSHVGLRASNVGGRPEEGKCRFTLSMGI